jgi:hypothetical protein
MKLQVVRVEGQKKHRTEWLECILVSSSSESNLRHGTPLK